MADIRAPIPYVVSFLYEVEAPSQGEAMQEAEIRRANGDDADYVEIERADI